MNKLLGIIVLGLLLSGNAYAKIDESYKKQIYEGCINDAKKDNNYNNESIKFCKCYVKQFDKKFDNERFLWFLNVDENTKKAVVAIELAPPCYPEKKEVKKKSKSSKNTKDISISCLNDKIGSRQYILEEKNKVIYEGNYSWDFSSNPNYNAITWNDKKIWVSFNDRVDTRISENIEIDRTTGVLLHRLSYPDGDNKRVVWNCKLTTAAKF